jgi:hypothetical protein
MASLSDTTREHRLSPSISGEAWQIPHSRDDWTGSLQGARTVGIRRTGPWRVCSKCASLKQIGAHRKSLPAPDPASTLMLRWPSRREALDAELTGGNRAALSVQLQRAVGH